MVWEDLTPQNPDPRRLLNAITVAMAVGCSTNAIIHLIAPPAAPGRMSASTILSAPRKVPVIANIRPSGDKYLMEDFWRRYSAGATMGRPRPPHVEALTVTGKTWATTSRRRDHNDDVIRPAGESDSPGGVAVLRGNPRPRRQRHQALGLRAEFPHTGPALVFDDYPSMKEAIDRDDLDVTADHVLVLRNAGPQGGPGMPEWGMLPIPKKLVKQGVRDMVRLSDARMSGTSYGACILHVSPESYIGGPLALLRTGDMISLDVDKRTLDMNVSDEELARRRAAWKKPEPRYERGYGWMFTRHIKQANDGCDFDFLETAFGAPVGEPSIY